MSPWTWGAAEEHKSEVEEEASDHIDGELVLSIEMVMSFPFSFAFGHDFFYSLIQRFYRISLNLMVLA